MITFKKTYVSSIDDPWRAWRTQSAWLCSCALEESKQTLLISLLIFRSNTGVKGSFARSRLDKRSCTPIPSAALRASLNKKSPTPSHSWTATGRIRESRSLRTWAVTLRTKRMCRFSKLVSSLPRLLVAWRDTLAERMTWGTDSDKVINLLRQDLWFSKAASVQEPLSNSLSSSLLSASCLPSWFCTVSHRSVLVLLVLCHIFCKVFVFFISF